MDVDMLSWLQFLMHFFQMSQSYDETHYDTNFFYSMFMLGSSHNQLASSMEFGPAK